MSLATLTFSRLSPARINGLFLMAVFLILAAYTRFEFFHLKHDDLASPKFRSHLYGDSDRKIDAVFEWAQKRANRRSAFQPGHFLYRGHNPGLFIFVTEVAIRMGVSSPTPLLIGAVVFANIGLVFGFFWITYLFKSRVIALIALMFLVSSPYLLYHVPSLHTDPFDFFFLNATLFAFTRFLDAATPRRRHAWLVATWIAYFLLCQSYYMFYVSAFVVMSGSLWLRDGRRAIRVLAILATAPITAMVLVVVQVSWIADGGPRRILDMFVARSIDGRIPDSRWDENRHYLTDFWTRYPQVMSLRYRFFFHFDWLAFVLLPFITVWLTDKTERRSTSLLYAVALAGFSWNLIMLQHSMIHEFSVVYGFFAWAVIFAVAAQRSALAMRAHNPTLKRVVGFAVLFFLIRGFKMGLARTFG